MLSEFERSIRRITFRKSCCWTQAKRNNEGPKRAWSSVALLILQLDDVKNIWYFSMMNFPQYQRKTSNIVLCFYEKKKKKISVLLLNSFLNTFSHAWFLKTHRDKNANYWNTFCTISITNHQFFYDVEPHQSRALWTHPWGINHGYMNPSTRTMYGKLLVGLNLGCFGSTALPYYKPSLLRGNQRIICIITTGF